MSENATGEAEFHAQADAEMNRLYNLLEEADAQGALEADYEGGILHVLLPSGKEYIVSKHAPSRQIWLSSPVSGGLHFSYDAVCKQWALPDGRILDRLLAAELQSVAGIAMTL